ncbi:MAG: FAD-dependent monooxygenase [Bacteroidales bacterium]|nr:FAD-dependent monooxygenase [Bacteroidales bacterium]
MENVDTLIIGAGPAGATCAYLLHKAGVECVLVDFATFPSVPALSAKSSSPASATKKYHYARTAV